MEKRGLRLWCGSIVLVAAVGLAYAGVVDNDFVQWDDDQYVTENPEVLGGLSWEGARWAFTTGHASNWHPVTWLSHMLDVDLFGEDPGAMALVNVALHMVSSVLLLLFLVRATGAFWPSMLVALLFAVHPLRVESVAWIAERKDVLAGLFGMLTLHAWLRYVRQPRATSYLLVMGALACGLMSKPSLVTMPFLLLVLDFWPLGRLRLMGESESVSNETVPLTRLVLEKLPLLALVALSSLVTLQVQEAGGSMRSENLSPFGDRVANAMTSYVAYIGKTIWPADLAFFYPLPGLAQDAPLLTGAVAGSFVLLASISVLAWWQRVRRPWLVTGWLWFVGVLVPMIGLVQVGRQSMADRYAYLSTIGLYVILAWTLAELPGVWARRATIAAGLAASIVFVGLTRQQVPTWRSQTALFEHALAVSEDNYVAHYNLGTKLLRGSPSRVTEARPHLEAAARLDPNHPGAHLNLGAVHWLEGRVPEAAVEFEVSVRLDPSDPQAHLSLGAARHAQGRPAESIREFGIVLDLDPENVDALLNLGTVLLELGRRGEASDAFERALEIQPGLQPALAGLRAAEAAD